MSTNKIEVKTTPVEDAARALALLWRDERAAGNFGPTDTQTAKTVFASIDESVLAWMIDPGAFNPHVIFGEGVDADDLDRRRVAARVRATAIKAWLAI